MKVPTRIAAGLLLVVLVFCVLLPVFAAWPLPGRDSGVFLYAGWRILEGDVPYRDVWDHKGPLVYALDALGLVLGGGSFAGVRALEAISLLLAAALAFVLLKRAFGLLPAAVASTLWLLDLGRVLDGGHLTEEWALPFAFGALVVFMRNDAGKRAWRKGILLGVVAAAAFLLRPNLAGTAFCIGLVLAVEALRGDRSAARFLGSACAGGAVSLGVVAAYFASKGALPLLVDQMFRFNELYVGLAQWNLRLHTLREGLGILMPGGEWILVLGAWVAGGGALLIRRDRLGEARPLLLLALFSLPLELVLASLSGRPFPHNFITWAPMVSVWLAFAARVLLDLGGRLFPRAAFAFPLLLLGFTVAPTRHLVEQAAEGRRLPPRPWADDAGEIVKAATRPSDTVLVWGAEASVNFNARRRAPGRFVYQLPLFVRGYQSPALVEEFLRDLKAKPPALILDASTSDRLFPPLDPEARRKWEAESSFETYGPLPEMSAVYAFVESRYERRGTIGWQRWPVWVRVASP